MLSLSFTVTSAISPAASLSSNQLRSLVLSLPNMLGDLVHTRTTTNTMMR